MYLDDYHQFLANIFFTLVKSIFGDISKMQFLSKNVTIKIDSLRNFLSMLYFYILYLISFQVRTKSIFTK